MVFQTGRPFFYLSVYLFFIFRMINPTKRPIIAGTTHPRFKSNQGRIFLANPMTESKCRLVCNPAGNVFNKSKIAAANVNAVTLAYTVLSCLNTFPHKASAMSVIANGYKNISTGTEYSIIFDNPKFETTRENAVKMIAHALYGSAFGNILSKVSEQLVTRPMEVFKQAKVMVSASTTLHKLPR